MPKEPIPAEWEGLPVVGAAEMRRLDEAATRRFGIAAETLMENAGAAAAEACAAHLRSLGREPAGAKVVVCCGRGANGGDGLVVARALAGAGATVSVFLAPPKKDAGGYPALVKAVLAKALAAGVSVKEAGEGAGLGAALAGADLAVDALLGTGASGKPAGVVHHMIQELTRSKKPVVALDIPSGIHPDTGYHSGAFVNAALTLTFGLPKRGLLAAHARKSVGALKILDIGYPAALVKEARTG